MQIKSPSSKFCLPENVNSVKAEMTEMPPLRMVQQSLKQYDAQISELDQAVSSITGDSSNENKLELTTRNVNGTSSSSMGIKVEQSDCQMMTAAQQGMQQQQQQSHQLNNDDGHMVHNTSDDSAMLNHVLDVMLDSKLINEILNAESELNFDENVLNESSSATNQHNNQQHHQQTVYLEQPLTKRMRFDDSSNISHLQQLASANHEITADYFVSPQQQTQLQQQSQQPQTQYAQYDTTMSGNISLDGQYQTSIDAMQLQQLLYQQQQQQQTIDATAYGANNSLNIANHQQQQHQQIYDPNGGTIVDTKQILELCGAGAVVGAQGNNNELLKTTEEYVTLPEDVSHQFQIFNVPSLTDDIEPEQPQPHITHHIVERQYVMPGNEDSEEQLIYEITTNNSVSSMSQQHQQQVLAEFLNQAASSYEQQQHQQLQQISHQPQLQQHQQQSHYITDNTNKLNNFYDELLEFDYGMIETVKSLSSSSTSGSGSSNSSNSSSSSSRANAVVKSERDSSLTSSATPTSSSSFKYHDDFYFNVFFYAGIPRPLAINCFGLIKLPQGVATTFRKHLLTTRKANNSLMSLGGGSLNGVVGQSSSAGTAGTVSTRFNNSKQLPSYFTNIVNNVSGSGNSNISNEFSIGSITITNASSNMQQQHGSNGSLQHQQQNKQSSGISTNPLEINLNSINGGISATSPVSSLSRGRTKSGGSNNSSGSFNSSSSSNLKHKSLPGLGNSVNATRVTVGTIGPYNAKTIFVSSATSLNVERNKCIKRSLIAKVQDVARLNQTIQTQQQFTSKKLSDLLSGKKPSSPLNSNDAVNSMSGMEMSAELAAERQTKLNRVNRFYEKRRKLLNIAQQQQNTRHSSLYQTNHNLRKQHLEQQLHPQQQQHHQQKLLKQQLIRGFSDCGINSATNANVTSTDSNVMRVFV